MSSATDPGSDPGSVPTPHRGHRLWMPATIGLLAAGAVLFLEFQADRDRNLLMWGQTAVVALALALTLLWFVFFSRIRWSRRLLVLAALGLTVLGLKQVLEVDGTLDGRGLPHLVWKKNPNQRRLPALPAPAPASTSTSASTPATNLPSSTPPSPSPSPAVSTPTAAAGAQDFPQFQGPLRNGVLTRVGLAKSWSATPPKELWRQPIGAAWSGFAVVGTRAYTQEQRGDEESVTCYDATTGRLLWSQGHPVRFFQWQGGEGPRATPTVDRGYVFTLGATGILDCLKADTGERVWSRSVFSDLKIENLLWGASASPLVFEDTVVITGGLSAGPTVLAFHRTTGEPLWTSGTDKASYASPVLATLGNKPAIVSFNAGTLSIHEPRTGTALLSHPWSNNQWPKAAQPVVLPGDKIFVTAGYGMGCEMFQLETRPDASLSVTSVWRNFRMKAQFNSVGYRDGFLYGLDDSSLACVDIATGERRWKEGRFGSGQSLVVDDLVIVQAEAGDVVLAEARPEAYTELGRVKALSSKTWNHPAVAGGLLLVRNDREAVAYSLPLAP